MITPGVEPLPDVTQDGGPPRGLVEPPPLTPLPPQAAAPITEIILEEHRLAPAELSLASGVPVRWTDRTGRTLRLAGIGPTVLGAGRRLLLTLVLHEGAEVPGGAPVEGNRLTWDSEVVPGGHFSRVFARTGVYTYALLGERREALTGTLWITQPAAAPDT